MDPRQPEPGWLDGRITYSQSYPHPGNRSVRVLEKE